MKKTIFSILLLFCYIATYGQSASEAEFIVQKFGNNLRDWCSTKNINYRKKAQEQCTDACRVMDKLMEHFVANSNLNIRDYVVPNYLNGFEEVLGKGNVFISMRNIKTISADEQSYGGTLSITQETKRSKNFTTVACDITVSGVLNYHIKDLFYLRKGKIVKITPYEEVEDSKTGKRKVKVDFSDLDDYETWGFSYNYGKSWPIGLSANYSYSWFMIGADLGVNLDKDKLYKLEMEDVMNFHKEEYDPIFFFTVTPSIYLKYVSIGCGLGILYMQGEEYTASSLGGSSTIPTEKVKFMLRPSIKGYIPLNDELYLSLSVGYDYAFGYKDKNGINFGLGLQFELW